MFRKSVLTAVAFASALNFIAPQASAERVKRTTTFAPVTMAIATSPKTVKVPGISFNVASDMKSKLNTMQWTMKAGSDGRPILSGNQYRMVNAVTQAGMMRQKRSVAANLGWLPTNSNDFNMRIRRVAGNGQVRYGDLVALEMKSYGWLKYKKQSRGINLSDDDNSPHFIWRITGGQPGTNLVAGMPFALFNTTIKAEMTYCKRTWGIDLGWAGKSDCDTAFARVSGAVFGPNGAFADDGFSGPAVQLLKDYICETAVSAAAAGVVATTGGTTSAIAATAVPFAIKECKERI